MNAILRWLVPAVVLSGCRPGRCRSRGGRVASRSAAGRRVVVGLVQRRQDPSRSDRSVASGPRHSHPLRSERNRRRPTDRSAHQSVGGVRPRGHASPRPGRRHDRSGTDRDPRGGQCPDRATDGSRGFAGAMAGPAGSHHHAPRPGRGPVARLLDPHPRAEGRPRRDLPGRLSNCAATPGKPPLPLNSPFMTSRCPTG